MTEIPLYLQFLFSFVATIGFSVFLNAPKKELFYCGITGSIGWCIFYIFNLTLSNDIFANFIATLAITILSELFARKLKKPAILFIIPGIIPLVPGLGIYKTMLNLVQGNYNLAISIGTNALLVSGSIAMGIIVTISMVRTVNNINKNTINK